MLHWNSLSEQPIGETDLHATWDIVGQEIEAGIEKTQQDMADENRFLHEIVDFHQFTTHNVVWLDDNGDMEDGEPEEDSNLMYAEKVLPVVEENSADEGHDLVLSRPESLMVSRGE